MKIKRSLCIGCFLLLFIASTAGCTKTGKMDEGDFACTIELETVPAEFSLLDEETRDMLEIIVYMQEVTTETMYRAYLNEENGFKLDASLNPGFYDVKWCTGYPLYLNYSVESRQEMLEVGGDRANYLSVYITDLEEFSDRMRQMNPSSEILAADMFSRMLQWEGQVIRLEDIADYVDFEYDKPVAAYASISLSNADERIGITVMNETDHEQSWQECTLKSVTFREQNAILGKGVMIGMPLAEVVHKEDGAFGTPDSIEGSVLLGTGYEQLRCYYLDRASGDKITIASNPEGEYVMAITYEFAVYQ